MKYFSTAMIPVNLLVVSLAVAQSTSDADEIRQQRAHYNAAIAAHDVPRIVSFLDDEYQITTSLGDLQQDRNTEAAGWRELIASRKDLLYVRSPDSIEVSSDYPLAAESGEWTGTWTTDGGPVRTGGRYAAMWHKAGGVWKVRSELFVALYCEGSSCP
jgi:ketosteroid isomerase-like protein